MKLTLQNRQGHALAVTIDFPSRGIKGTALFAHCFTCGKDLRSSRIIAQALSRAGIAVVRFDFSGLGTSEGDFALSSFTSNIDDLVDIADALPDSIPKPALLIGHSLGGAAVLAAAHHIASVTAVVTLCAPSVAAHVKHLLDGVRETIQREGVAALNIGLKPVMVGKNLLEDLDKYTSTERIGSLKKALLVMHSPLDNIVSIDEASAIYSAAKHPKSFVSLDQADHMLAKPSDAEYAATIIAAWSNQYLSAIDEKTIEEGRVIVGEIDNKFLRSMSTPSHTLISDEPHSVGGGNAGPTPYDLLLMALGSCTSMTLRMYVNRKGWDTGEIKVELEHTRTHQQDAANKTPETKLETLRRTIVTEKSITDEQREALLRIADRCPVHRTLENNPKIDTLWQCDEHAY